MTDIITISWGSGCMKLLPQKFFPTTIPKTRKVFKLLLADEDWTPEKVNEFINYLRERKAEVEKHSVELEAESKSRLEKAEHLKKTYRRNSQGYHESVMIRQDGVHLRVEARQEAKAAQYFEMAAELLKSMRRDAYGW